MSFARRLPDLIVASSPGNPNDFLQEFSDNCRCNMTLIEEFQSFYEELVEKAKMLELLYKSLEVNATFTGEKAFWKRTQSTIDSAFKIHKTACKKRFRELLEEDMSNTESAKDLQTKNKERYNWLLNDVVYVKSGVPGKLS